MTFQKGNKIGVGRKGYWLGKKMSVETRRKMSIASKGKPKSLEARKHQSETLKRIGRIPPSRKGKHWTEESRRKISEARKGEKSHRWKGDKVGNKGVHQWVKKWKGNPSLCEMCGTTKAKRYDWANVDHSYKRILEDYIRLCKKCHFHYDTKHNNYKSFGR